MPRSTNRLIHLVFLSWCGLMCLCASVALAKEQTAKPTPSDRQEQSLKDFFSELLKKRAAVGGTVLRGDSAQHGFEIQGSGLPLLLNDHQAFKVLPGTTKVRLNWSSSSQQQWTLRLDQTALTVIGGSVEIDLPVPISQKLHQWELRPVGVSAPVLSGSWFFLQGLQAPDALVLNGLLARDRAAGLRGSNAYRQVCQWMHQEQLINFNEWCLDV